MALEYYTWSKWLKIVILQVGYNPKSLIGTSTTPHLSYYVPDANLWHIGARGRWYLLRSQSCHRKEGIFEPKCRYFSGHFYVNLIIGRNLPSDFGTHIDQKGQLCRIWSYFSNIRCSHLPRNISCLQHHKWSPRVFAALTYAVDSESERNQVDLSTFLVYNHTWAPAT